MNNILDSIHLSNISNLTILNKKILLREKTLVFVTIYPQILLI